MRTVAALLLLLAAGCSPGGTPRATPAPAPTATSTATSSAASPAASPAVVVETGDPDVTQFSLPSGNIGCVVEARGARCDIASYTWTLPPKPAGCDADWGPGAELTTTAQVGVCASDAARGGTRVLAYGHAIAVGDVRCDSATTGITCRNTRTRHGFTLSRAAYRLF
jgi:hypothetical protein